MRNAPVFHFSENSKTRSGLVTTLYIIYDNFSLNVKYKRKLRQLGLADAKTN